MDWIQTSSVLSVGSKQKQAMCAKLRFNMWCFGGELGSNLYRQMTRKLNEMNNLKQSDFEQTFTFATEYAFNMLRIFGTSVSLNRVPVLEAGIGRMYF